MTKVFVCCLILIGFTGCAASNFTEFSIPLPGGQVAHYCHNSKDYKDDRSIEARLTLDKKGVTTIYINGKSAADVNVEAHRATLDAQMQMMKGLSDLVINIASRLPVGGGSGVMPGPGPVVVPAPTPPAPIVPNVNDGVANATAWAAGQPAFNELGNMGPWSAPLPVGATLPNPGIGAMLPTDVLRPWSTSMWIEVSTVVDGYVPGQTASITDLSNLFNGIMTKAMFDQIVGSTTVTNPVYLARNAAYSARFNSLLHRK